MRWATTSLWCCPVNLVYMLQLTLNCFEYLCDLGRLCGVLCPWDLGILNKNWIMFSTLCLLLLSFMPMCQFGIAFCSVSETLSGHHVFCGAGKNTLHQVYFCISVFSLVESGTKPVGQCYLPLIFHLLKVKDSGTELRPHSGAASCQNLASVPNTGEKLLWQHRTLDAPLHAEELYRGTSCQ